MSAVDRWLLTNPNLTYRGFDGPDVDNYMTSHTVDLTIGDTFTYTPWVPAPGSGWGGFHVFADATVLCAGIRGNPWWPRHYPDHVERLLIVSVEEGDLVPSPWNWNNGREWSKVETITVVDEVPLYAGTRLT